MDQTEIKNLLNSRGLKATNIRLEFLENLKEYNSAMPFSMIQKSMHEEDRVTIYRTLNTLEDKGIIHKVMDESETYFALCNHECKKNEHHHDHIHFKCEKCKTLTCQNVDLNLTHSLVDFEIHELNIQATGICKACLSI